MIVMAADEAAGEKVAELVRSAKLATEAPVARTAGEGVGLMSSRKVDVILLFDDFEGAPGKTAIETIRAEGYRSPILVLAREDDEQAAVAMIDQGADDFLVAESLTAPALTRAVRFALSRHETERELAASERRNGRLAEIISAAEDLVLVIDSWERVVFMNEAAERFFGIQETEGDTKVKAADILSSMDGDMWHLALPELIFEGKWKGEFALRNQQGDEVRHAVTVIHHERGDDSEAFYSLVANDLSALTAAAERVHMHGKMQAKSQFIASISHEVRTPLTAVLGFADLLADGGLEGDAEGTAEIMRMISEQAQEVSNIIEDLMVNARSDVGQVAIVPAKLDLLAQARAAAQPLEASMPGLSIIGEHVPALADEVRVRQIIRNLLTNARRYGGSNVIVRVSGNGSESLVAVCDDGDGVPPDRRGSIFEPFETFGGEDTRAVAVGLGLAVSRELAQLMGGDLGYDYVDGWSHFTLRLPTPAA